MSAQHKGQQNELWAKRFARFNEWTPGQKCLLICALILPAQLAFKLFFDAMLGPLADFTWLFWVGLGAWALCACCGAIYVFLRSTSRLPFFALVYAYGSWLITVSYQTGWLDSSYSMYVPMGIMVFALVGCWQAVLHWLALWTCATLLVGSAQFVGILEYGPMYSTPMELVRPSVSWLLMNVAFLLQMVLITLAVLWLVTNSRDQAFIALRRSNTLVRRYMPPAVAEQILAGAEQSVGAPVRKRVTILFADIVGFTDIADRLEPEVMTDVLSEYLSAMVELVEQHGGTLNEFAGDGLMALWGAPEALAPEDQVKGAVTAALAMQAKMPILNENWRKLGLGTELKIRIGINTGVASVGSFGSQGRMTYTAIGLQTNIAARIESKAKPGQILVSDSTFQLISDQVDCEARGEVECKGVHFPVKVYVPRNWVTGQSSFT